MVTVRRNHGLKYLQAQFSEFKLNYESTETAISRFVNDDGISARFSSQQCVTARL